MDAVTSPERALYFEYLRHSSVSADPAQAGAVRGCAEWLKDLLASWGLESELGETAGAPVVFARTARKPGLATVMLYGHYDVQPAEPLELWTSPPFEPSERGGLVHARGATDNKGQTFAHLIGLRRMLDAGALPLNLIVLIEGEEEIGSPNLRTFLDARADDLACDAVLVSDTSMIAPGWPALTLGLRGIACFEAEVDGPDADLHSGMFGGAVVNPAAALARILARLHDADGRIAIPGFHDGLIPVSQRERDSWEGLPWNADWIRRMTGLEAAGGERELPVLERIWTQPTAEINGLTSGYQGAGSKTIIPARASAKLSFRLVPGQHPDRIAALVADWFAGCLAAERVTGRMIFDHGGNPYFTSPDDPWIQAAARSCASVFGRAPAFIREGLSIPVVEMLAAKFSVPIVLAGLGLPDCKAHSPNESFPVAHLGLGAELFRRLMAEWAEWAGVRVRG